MNVERQHCIFVESWSDSVHIALWRKDGFLHSFRYFSESNAFSENLIRMKFILHKIFLQISLLLEFQLIIIITVTIQVAVLNFHEIHMVGATSHMGEDYFFFFWKPSVK